MFGPVGDRAPAARGWIATRFLKRVWTWAARRFRGVYRRRQRGFSSTHLPDQFAQFLVHLWPTAEIGGFPAPPGSETRSMPADDRVRPNDRDGICDLWNESTEQDEYSPVAASVSSGPSGSECSADGEARRSPALSRSRD